MSSLVGVWHLAESNNWEKYLDTYQTLSGFSYMNRRRSSGTIIRPTCEITKRGDVWTIKMPSSLRSKEEITFFDGLEFEEDIINDQKIKCLIKSEGDNKLIEFQKDYKTGQIITTIIREVINKQLVQTLISGDKVCTRIFKQKEDL